jgi:cytochrome c biogenesis protein CcdA
MRRSLALLVGAIVGMVLAGVMVAALMAMLPENWRTERVVWGSSCALVGVTLLAAFVLSRGAPD